MKRLLVWIVMWLAAITTTLSQDRLGPLSVGIHGGISHPGAIEFGGVDGGSGGDWASGVMVGADVQWAFSGEHWKLFMGVDWSRHSRRSVSWVLPAENDPHMTTTDATFGFVYSFAVVYLKAGTVFSLQESDKVVISQTSQIDGSRQNSFGLALAVGGEFPLVDRLRVYFEGGFRYRSFNSMYGLVGLRYELL
jgi:hypothetical protein